MTQRGSRTKDELSAELSQLLGAWRWKRRAEYSLYSATGIHCRSFCSPPSGPGAQLEEAIEIHKKKLFLWFNHLPQEEKQFGGYFSPETMHVDPLILERNAEERAGLLTSPLQTQTPSSGHLTVEQLFETTDAWSEGRGLNVLLYGAVGTGKSTVVRKLMLDWCAGTTLTHFKLLGGLLEGPCGQEVLPPKKTPLLGGEGNQARDVLFLFNGMEKMKLDFRIGATELCSDPNEVLPPGVVVVNLLRKYLLPEASILVTTRLSALDRIPQKYVTRYAQICGFNDPDRQRAYFTSRLMQQIGETTHNNEAHGLIELLYLNLQRESQLAAACFLPSYCWLTCATLHFLHFTDAKAPIRTLTGIYTSFLRLNFGGEVLGIGTGTNAAIQEQHNSLMLYVVRTVGKLAFDGVTNKRTSFSEEELEQWIGGKTKTDEELRQLAMFRTDVLDFFLAPCVESFKHLSEDPKAVFFAVPAMQEYLAALYVVLGENKSALEKMTKQVSVAIGQASEDVSAIFNILSKFIPLRIFAVFNLLKLFPKLYEKISIKNQGGIARTMAAEMFRTEDRHNEDVLDQVEQSLLGVHGPDPSRSVRPSLLSSTLSSWGGCCITQLGCSIQSTTVAQITHALRKYLVRELSQPQPPEELMDLLLLLYEFQNPRLTAEVLASIRSIRLTNVRMTSLKCFVLSSVLSCTPASYRLEELDLSSCLLTQDRLPMLWPAFRHTFQLNLQFNSLGPESCILLRDLLLDPESCIRSLHQHSAGGLPREPVPDAPVPDAHRAGGPGAQELAKRLQQHKGLQELNVAYNNIGDRTAMILVDACREHPSIHTVHLYLNPLTDVGKQSLYVRGDPKSQSGRRVKVLASVTEGSDLCEDWHPILSVIQKNISSWDRQRVKDQLKVFLRDLEWGRQQQQSFWKRLHFRRVEKGVRQTLRMLEKDTIPPSSGKSKWAIKTRR
ncbi:hypothetical protein F7725_020331 [Dissostichus mawsoni]|uniref:NLR family member X1 n=1 Tax=Dissostichus mawsoni TaxID=36200 RepID=A0A7J5YDW0_DISMA|nr:hypothetical protein F7725_020331 [Dissostichus mawsoni]